MPPPQSCRISWNRVSASRLSCASPSSTDIIYNRHLQIDTGLAEQRIGDAVERRDHRPDALALDEPEFGGQRRRLEDLLRKYFGW